MLLSTRRDFVRSAGLAAGAVLLAACGPKATPAPAPTAAPAAQEPAAQAPTTAPVKAEEPVTIRFMTRAGINGDHMREFAKRYQDESEGKVIVETEDTEWGEVSTKIELQLVAGIMVDVCGMDNAVWPTIAVRDAFAPLDPYVEKYGLDLSEWFNVEWHRRWTDGKLSALGGGAGVLGCPVFYNMEWVLEAWGKEPTDDWTMDDYVECMTACVEYKGGPGKGFFGGNVDVQGAFFSNFEAFARRFGGGLLDQDTKTVIFDQPKMQDCMKFVLEQMANGNYAGRLAPGEDQVMMFLAQNQATFLGNPGHSAGMAKGAEEAGFTVKAVLPPNGPSSLESPPRRAFCPYTNSFSVAATSKYPDEAFRLIERVCSSESMLWLFHKVGKQPGARFDVWYHPDVVEKFPIFPRIADRMKECTDVYPVPWNTRFKEFGDIVANEVSALAYGEVEYNQANIDRITNNLKAVVALPLPE